MSLNTTNMISIQEKEDELFERWKVAFEKNGDTGFCADGLIFNGELFNNSKNSLSGNQEELWNNAKRKVLFFMKDPNDNEGEDYREWGLYQKTSSTFLGLYIPGSTACQRFLHKAQFPQ